MGFRVGERVYGRIVRTLGYFGIGRGAWRVGVVRRSRWIGVCGWFHEKGCLFRGRTGFFLGGRGVKDDLRVLRYCFRGRGGVFEEEKRGENRVGGGVRG